MPVVIRADSGHAASDRQGICQDFLQLTRPTRPCHGRRMSDPFQDNALHWRRRADKMRTLADQLQMPEAKRATLETARACERLAEMAEASPLAHLPTD